jgi:flagellin FlaB
VKKMKNEMNEKSDNLAAIGIGAMIVFIALILVAAVAAAVIIQTAEKLQQNAQATGDDTQEQMSTKVVLLSTVISDMTGGSENLFSTFELAPGSEPIQGDDIAYTVICDNAGAATFADGEFNGATLHTGDGATVVAPVITLNPGTTYVVDLDITGCAPSANQDHIMIISVDGGGNTYEELQYGSSPDVGDVVV